MPATTYSVTISLSDDTRTKLEEGGYILYGSRPVAVGSPPIADVCAWFQTNKFSPVMHLSWTESYLAYVAPYPADIGLPDACSIQLQPGLNQTVTVENGTPETGECFLSQGSTLYGTVTITNPSTVLTYTCGVSLPMPSGIPGGPQHTCNVLLQEQGSMTIAPQPGLFLMFATVQLDPGTSYPRTYGPGILIPLTPASPTQAVAFVMETGWSGGGGTPHAAGEDLTSFLTQVGVPAVPAPSGG